MTATRVHDETLRKLSAHIGYLFTELPLLGRIEAAGLAGFQAVEHPDPFALDSRALRSTLSALGLSFSQLAVSSDHNHRGGKGLAALPGRESDFRDGLLRSIDYAVAIGCPLVHPMSGIPPVGAPAELIRNTYYLNLEYAAELAGQAGLAILVEPISEKVVPGYFACSMEIVLEAVDQVASGEIVVLLDTFHARIDGLDMTDFIRRYSQLIGHIHVADFPGRHEPGTGSIDFPAILAELDAAGYRGALGFEYSPATTTEKGLGWLTDPTWRKPSANAPSTFGQINRRAGY